MQTQKAFLPNWQQDLSWSAVAFEELVWPTLSKQIGGRIVHVETVTHSDFARDLDRQAGIDAWHILSGERGIRGIASRVQVCSGHPYNTFTVRRSRDSGGATEYAKRLLAIQSNLGLIYPELTIQAYITGKEAGQLLSVGVCRTKDLILHIHDHELSITVRRTVNATFFVVPFQTISVFTYP